MKKLLLMTLVVMLLGPYAALAEEEPRIYVIKKGDTLWGISQRFIQDPYYWPSLWANNPMVKNPHFIYPGQKLHIYDGRIELVPAYTVEEKGEPVAEPEVEVFEEPEVAEEPVVFPVPEGGEGFVATSEMDDAGILIDTVDNRIMIATAEKVFVEMSDLGATQPGEHYALFKRGRKVEHPVTGETVGFRIDDLGELRIEQVHEQVASAVITKAYQEIERGSRLRPVPERRKEIELKKAPEEIDGYVVEGHRNKISMGEHDLLYVDIGAENGLEKGNLLNISRQRQSTLLAIKEEVQLPERLLGAAVVVEVRDRTATALVLKSVDAIERGDRVQTATR